jgi:Domain of unknown function (DUF3870)
VRDEVLVVGYAKMPEGTAVRATAGTLAVGAVVDTSSHRVIRAWTTLASVETDRWVSSRLAGVDLTEAPATFPEEIKRTYWGHAQAAICQCYRDLVRRYLENLGTFPPSVGTASEPTQLVEG